MNIYDILNIIIILFPIIIVFKNIRPRFPFTYPYFKFKSKISPSVLSFEEMIAQHELRRRYWCTYHDFLKNNMRKQDIDVYREEPPLYDPDIDVRVDRFESRFHIYV